MKIEAEIVLQEIQARSQTMRNMAQSLMGAGQREASLQIVSHCEGLEHAGNIVARHGRLKRPENENETET